MWYLVVIRAYRMFSESWLGWLVMEYAQSLAAPAVGRQFASAILPQFVDTP